MKKLILVFVILNASLAMGNTLPKSCENLAWKYVTVQIEAEAYADIVDVNFNQAKNEYSALVRPTETQWFQFKFKYNKSSDQCLLLNVKGFYR